MTFMLYIDDYAAWSATSLAAAQDLARGYMNGSRPLKILGYDRAAGTRTWVYDYERGTWREHDTTDHSVM